MDVSRWQLRSRVAGPEYPSLLPPAQRLGLNHEACGRRRSGEGGEQHFGLLQVSGVKSLGEPAIDLREERVRCGALALLLPQTRQAHGGAQLERFRPLAPGYGQGLL